MPKNRPPSEEFEEPPIEYEDEDYKDYIAETQNFLETIAEFNQDNLNPKLAENLLGLKLVWGHIDKWLAAARPDNAQPAERVFSGFTEEGDYFEMYDDDRYLLGIDASPYIGHLGFYTHVTEVAPSTSIILPDPYIGDDDFMQFRFSLTPIASEVHGITYTGADAFPGRPFLQIGLAPEMPPEDFFFYNEGRRFLFPTATFQERADLYADEPRDSMYFPGKPPTPPIHSENQ